MSSNTKPKDALAYIRLSNAKHGEHQTSPERQRRNIERICARRGLNPIFFTDVSGHKSGMAEENREGYLNLKTYIDAYQPYAVIFNEFSRLHRNAGNMMRFLDDMKKRNIKVIEAVSDKEVNISNVDEWYMSATRAVNDQRTAMETGERVRDSVRHRHLQGIIAGSVPFGTVRHRQKFLKLTTEGVWVFSDGSIQTATSPKTAPHSDAIWRGYAQAAQRCLELVAEGRMGRRAIADYMNQECWYFRNRSGKPRAFTNDDVRRIACNWIEYGGGTLFTKTRSRYRRVPPGTVALDPKRAVFDVELCKRVGDVLYKNSTNRRSHSQNAVRLDATAYPLSKLLYCAHCLNAAQVHQTPKIATYLTGKTGNKAESRRYRHNTERVCTAVKRSVIAEVVEQQVLILLRGLQFRQEAIPVLEAEIAARNLEYYNLNPATILRARLIHWRQRRRHTIKLFEKAAIQESEWQSRYTEAEHQIHQLEARLEGMSDEVFELTLGMTTNMVENWNEANGNLRRLLAHALFESLTFDLDMQQITDWKFRSWVEAWMEGPTVSNRKMLPGGRSAT